MRSRSAVPGTHLLRQVFERAPDYDSAVEMLADERVRLAMPTLFTLAGTEPDEGCVIEGFGRARRLHRSADTQNGALGVANQWLSTDLRGNARNHAVGTGSGTTAEENNRIRRKAITRLQSGDFRGAADLDEPVLNSHTVMVVTASARHGEMTVEGLEAPPSSVLPRVIARRSIADPAAQAPRRPRSRSRKAQQISYAKSRIPGACVGSGGL
jgi:hypothetical protein